MKKFFAPVISIISVIFCLYILNNSTILAQEIQCKVNVNIERIAQENRQYILSMQSDIENYINNQRFINQDWVGDKIPVDINIVLSGGTKNIFSAQLFVASKRFIASQEGGQSVSLKLIDKVWKFEYNQGAMLSYNPSRFNEFSSLIDYYMLIVIGFDMDTYGELDGTRVYDQAKQIVQMAATYNADGYETNSLPGEFTRYTFVSELTDLRFEPLRKLIFSYYVDGLDLMRKDKDQALKNLVYIFQEMADFKKKKLSGASVLFQAFFDAKALEIAETLKGYTKYPNVFKDLMYLDPTNTQVYLTSQEGK
jgi:hypothetical protein